jgi:membrane-associated phospholipid phosphatase
MTGNEIILYLQGLRSYPLDVFMLSISALGSRYAYMVMLPVIYWLMDRRRGWVLALVFLLLMQVNAAIKQVTEIRRPYKVDDRVVLIGPEPYTYAFPSGHAQGSLMIYGGITVMYPSAVSVLASGSLVFLVGLTRLYLGVHSFLDVSVGWLLGGLGLVLMHALFNQHRKKAEILENWHIRLFWAASGIGITFLLPSKDTVLAGSTLTAVAMLEYFERKWIGFDNSHRVSQRLARSAAGFVPAFLVLVAFKFLSLESLWMQGIFFFLMGGWMVLGAPYLFKKLKI